MILDLEEKAALQKLLDSGIITKSQFDKAISPVVVVSAIKTKILNFIKFLSLIHWKEDIKYFKSKKILIYVVIAGLIYLGAYWHGCTKSRDVKIPVGVNEIIHVKKSGDVQFETKEGKVFHVVSKDDMNVLKGELSPFGFQFKIIGVVGSSFGTGTDKFEGGAGFSWLRLWQVDADTFVTNAGIYPLGVSYSLKALHMPNTGIGIGVGKGFKASETKSILYLRVNF